MNNFDWDSNGSLSKITLKKKKIVVISEEVTQPSLLNFKYQQDIAIVTYNENHERDCQPFEEYLKKVSNKSTLFRLKKTLLPYQKCSTTI